MALEVPSGVDHDPWGRLLAKYVDDQGRVDYPRFAASARDRGILFSYLGQFARTGKPPAVGGKRIASLINAQMPPRARKRNQSTVMLE